MEHDIPFESSNRENGTTFLDFPLFLGIFQWDEPTKRVAFTAEPEIPEILTKWKTPFMCSMERYIERYIPVAQTRPKPPRVLLLWLRSTLIVTLQKRKVNTAYILDCRKEAVEN